MEREPQVCRLKVFPFGTVCSPVCAGYALRRTAQDNEGLFPCPWSVQCMTPWGSPVLSYYLLKLSCKTCTVVD